MQGNKPDYRIHESVSGDLVGRRHSPVKGKHGSAAGEKNTPGTGQIALAAYPHGVGYFVLISTFKVVRPAGNKGATGWVAGIVIRALQNKTGTQFVAPPPSTRTIKPKHEVRSSPTRSPIWPTGSHSPDDCNSPVLNRLIRRRPVN